MDNGRLMHYFSGHIKDGFFYTTDPRGIKHIWTSGEVRADRNIIWMRTHDSGEFYWPHVQLAGQKDPVELQYDMVV